MTARREIDAHAQLLRIVAAGLLIISQAACAGLGNGARAQPGDPTVSVVHNPDGSYDYAAMYRLYNMAEAVWRGNETFRDTDWELDYFDHEETRTHGLAIREDDTLYIAFRATSSTLAAADQLLNLQVHQRAPAWLDGPSPVQVHRGFMSRYEAVREEVLSRILTTSAENIVFTGASAGGALSLLAFMDALVLLDESTPISHVSFGKPRIFDAAGARWLRETAAERVVPATIVRVVNGNDRVPSIPPMIFGYRHVVPAHHIGPQRRWYLISGEDHHPGYIESLQALAREEGTVIEELPYSRTR